MKFPSIEQYRHVIRAVRDHAAITNTPVPTLNLIGTVKLHGTNAGITRKADGSFVYHSRNRDICLGDDNAGFCHYMVPHEATLNDLFDDIDRTYNCAAEYTLFGEWCGPGIQKGVAINQLEHKMFVIFAIRAGERWLDFSGLSSEFAFPHDQHIYSIYNFDNYTTTVNFDFPEISQNTLVEMTLDVEQECPVGRYFGVEGIGEGIVWKPAAAEYNSSKFWFKVKGEKHSVTKVSKLVEVDVEAFAKKKELIEAIVTEQRLAQGLDLFRQEHGFEMKNIGIFLRWVFNDATTEEADRIAASGFEAKDLGKPIADIAKRTFMANMEKQNAEVS